MFHEPTHPGGIPVMPSASSAEAEEEVKEENPQDLLTDLLAQFDTPPGPS